MNRLLPLLFSLLMILSFAGCGSDVTPKPTPTQAISGLPGQDPLAGSDSGSGSGAVANMTATAVAHMILPTAAPGTTVRTTTPDTPPPLPSALATATVTPVVATATATPRTETPDPGPPPPRVVRFEPGTTSATFNDRIEGIELDQYVVPAQAGQLMRVDLTTPGTEALLSVVTGSGIPLKRAFVEGMSFTGRLPETGEYLIGVQSAFEQTTDYTLTIRIDPLPAPQRIEFEAGATATRVDDVLPSGTVVMYVVRALAGQRLEVNVDGDPPGWILLQVQGPHHEVLRWGNDETTAWLILPETGDYRILLYENGGAPDISYNLSVRIVSAPPITPTRVYFRPGESHATWGHTLSPGATHGYILGAAAGQELDLTVRAEPSGLVAVEIVDAAGNRLATGDDTPNIPLRLTLPSSDDYLILLSTPLAAPSVSYQITVRIE